MTLVTTAMSNNDYWNKMSYDSLTYFDEFPMDLINNVLETDIDFLNSYDTIIQEKHEETSSSSSSSEADQHSIQASSTNSPPIESLNSNLICGVCGAPAHGYNFDQITCESCKAFFRRNALRNTSQLKCRFAGTCIINMSTRRQCTYCRLKKCFDIKMRKDWIRTEEERELRQLKKLNKQQRKLNKLSSNQELIVNLPLVARRKKRFIQSNTKPITNELIIKKVEPIYPMNTFAIHRNLSDNDKILFNNIINAYKIGADKADCSHITRYTSSSSLSQFINNETINYQSLIHFFKNIPEFKQFDVDDQILLIKCNIIYIIHLHHVIVQNFQEIPQIAAHMSHWISPNFHYQMSQTRKKFDFFMKYPLILQLSMIIYIFSINLSLPRGSSKYMNYKNKIKLYQCQNYYVSILWRYLNYIFNEYEAIRSMQIIVMQILRYQTLMNIMSENLEKNGHQNILDPLMQSIFGLT